MPAKSKAQQKAAGAALAAKRGEIDVSDLQEASKEMFETMSEDELVDLASTDHEGLPERVEEDQQSATTDPRALGPNGGERHG